MEETRVCNTCNLCLPLDYFGEYRSKNRPEKRRRLKCKICRRIETKMRYENNPEVKEKMRATAKRHHLFKNYGMTQEDYDEMLVSQNYSCAICGDSPLYTLNVDHCHTTGVVRGLLCWECNIGIGKFKDDTNLLLKTIEYLEASR